MYEAYFGFNENPFNLSPDPRFIFLSPYHREALDHLGYGILERKGFVMITGGVGTGKTTLCRSFFNGLDEKVETAMIFNSFLSELELLATITEEFGMAKKRTRKTLKYYIDALNIFLLENFSAGKHAVLLIDEAQNLTHGVLEQIRMLSNLETEREKLIQIVLIGQPELRDFLCLPSLRQLNERITIRYHLRALDRCHIGPYVDHRLSVAGGQGRIRFAQSAYRMIHDYSEGIPRRINAICDRCLLIAYTKDLFLVERRTVKDAMKDMGPHYIMPKRRFFKFLD